MCRSKAEGGRRCPSSRNRRKRKNDDNSSSETNRVGAGGDFSSNRVGFGGTLSGRTGDGGRFGAVRQLIPRDIDVYYDAAPPPDPPIKLVTLDFPLGGRTRLRPADDPGPDIEEHEIPTGEWLTSRGVDFEWFDPYRKRRSPDIFINGQSVEFKALLPWNGVFSKTDYEYALRHGMTQSRRILVDSRETNLSRKDAENLIKLTLRDYGANLDELVIILNDLKAIGWTRA